MSPPIPQELDKAADLIRQRFGKEAWFQTIVMSWDRELARWTNILFIRNRNYPRHLLSMTEIGGQPFKLYDPTLKKD